MNKNSNNDINSDTNLNIMTWNIQGLGAKLSDCDFMTYINKFDIVVFLETMKLDTYKPTLHNYSYKHYQRKFQHPRARKPAGGIGVLINTLLSENGTVTVVKNSDFAVWLKIKQRAYPDLYFGVVYIPPPP